MSDLRTDAGTDPAVLLAAPAPEIRALDRKKFSWGFWLAAGWLVLIVGLALLAPVLPMPALSDTSLAVKNLGPFRDLGHLLGGYASGGTTALNQTRQTGISVGVMHMF